MGGGGDHVGGRDGPGPEPAPEPEPDGLPWPVGTVLVSPDPADPTVWVRATDDGSDDADWFEVDPRRRVEPYAWVFRRALPARPKVLRRGPDSAR